MISSTWYAKWTASFYRSIRVQLELTEWLMTSNDKWWCSNHACSMLFVCQLVPAGTQDLARHQRSSPASLKLKTSTPKFCMLALNRDERNDCSMPTICEKPWNTIKWCLQTPNWGLFHDQHLLCRLIASCCCKLNPYHLLRGNPHSRLRV